MFSRIFEAKKRTKSFFVLLFEISKEFFIFIDLKITELTRLTTIQGRLFLLNTHFVHSLLATRARQHFKFMRSLLSSYEYLVNLSISVVVLRTKALNKYINISPPRP